ncbi:hypothetical protein [Tannockella kyphosi]|uniref:hypothetical protein n=1 Tax=Tannockella kyphosi TaxID=2899121 RepID=UPI002011E63D|nr:hypothetical protein [Tannockella kyphosi]
MIDKKSKEAYDAIHLDESFKYKIESLEAKQSNSYLYSKRLAFVFVLLLCCTTILVHQTNNTAPILTQVLDSSGEIRTISNEIQVEFYLEITDVVSLSVSDGYIMDEVGNEVVDLKESNILKWTIDGYEYTESFYLFVQYDNQTDKYMLSQNENFEWIIERGNE